jgi:hypothetical protein
MTITQHMKNFSLAVCTVLFFSSFIAVPAHAEGLAVKVQPSTLEEVVDPGQVLEGTLTVTNENGGAQTYFITTRNVTGMSDTGTPSFSSEEDLDNDPMEAASWIKPLVESVSMDVGESKTVPYRIEVPQNASPGAYFAAFFVTREAEAVTQSGAGVGFHVASLVNLRVRGEVNEDMLFREFFTEKSFFTKPSVLFKARIDNTGSVHQRPQGIINISNMFGKSVGQVSFNENAGAILPHFDRVFETTWNYDGFAFGRYTANASIVFGESQKNTLSKEVSFWIIPVKEVGIVLGVIVGILLILIFAIRRYVRNALRKAGQTNTSSQKSSSNVSFAKRLVRNITWLIVLLLLIFLGMVSFFSL